MVSNNVAWSMFSETVESTCVRELDDSCTVGRHRRSRMILGMTIGLATNRFASMCKREFDFQMNRAI